MVKLNKIYTRTGDDGSTGLTDGSRVPKHSSRPQAYGSVDELNSSLGLVYFCLNKDNSNPLSVEIKDLIKEIQNDLFDLGADLSTPKLKGKQKYPPLRIEKSQIDKLEKRIDHYNADLTALNSFILPGGSEISCWLHIARTVARRAERSMTKLAEKNKINKQSLIYINRLSDFLFVVSRVTNDNGKSDILWVPGENQ